MNELFNWFGLSAFWLIVVLAMPLAIAGWVLRRDARRRAGEVARARAAARGLREIGPGAVTLTGTWRGGFLEDEVGCRVLVEREPDAAPIADGARVLVVGCATHEIDDPRANYRSDAKLWVIDARGDGALVTHDTNALAQAESRALVRGSLGVLLFACSLAVALGAYVVAWRAAHDVGISYEESR
jgi:hypothetical protein